jgi:hypothetical protein
MNARPPCPPRPTPPVIKDNKLLLLIQIKRITRLRPVRHWLYNRVMAHVFICHLASLLLTLLQYRPAKLDISTAEGILELKTMYNVYLRA